MCKQLSESSDKQFVPELDWHGETIRLKLMNLIFFANEQLTEHVLDKLSEHQKAYRNNLMFEAGNQASHQFCDNKVLLEILLELLNIIASVEGHGFKYLAKHYELHNDGIFCKYARACFTLKPDSLCILENHLK